MSDDPASIEAWQEEEKGDLVARLRVINHHTKKLAENEGLHYVHREAFTRCEDLTWEAANEIERLRKKLRAEENAYDILRLENEHLQTDRNNLALSLKELEDKCKRLEIELGRYKRMYCRAVCKGVYASGAKWRIRPNPFRDDGVFIEEDCEPGKQQTYCAFPHQFAHDDAEEIIFLLNRATEDRKEKNNER
jgi:DNA repair exonuclease SbcCD ATPase subunit